MAELKELKPGSRFLYRTPHDKKLREGTVGEAAPSGLYVQVQAGVWERIDTLEIVEDLTPLPAPAPEPAPHETHRTRKH